jgi:hypothetical protein
MTRRLAGALGLAALVVGLAPGLAFGQEKAGKGLDSRKAAKALAERIDKIINARLEKENVKPGPKAEIATFARRMNIDLIGKIPALTEVVDFIAPDNDSPDKLDDRLDELLESPLFVSNWSHYWRSIMLGGTNNAQAQQFNFQFEGWLRDRLARNIGYDKMVQEVITGQPGNLGQNNNPAAFYFVNENKAENLAGASARVFLGVKIECAQCHKHPFAKWTREQFWEYAAFFAGVQQQFRGGPPQKGVDPNGRSIKIPDTDKVVQAKFINGDNPDWTGNKQPRNVLAEWMTSPKNPYFAKAAVDHVWQYFFGVSLMEPIFEPTDDSPPAHPELLDELANSFTESGYDLKFLIRAIIQTEAYQRGSIALNADNKEQIQLFARMPVRGMMPEQLFDCFAEATDLSPAQRGNNGMDNFNQGFGVPNTPRGIFLAKFQSQDKRIETQTSILQALYLMNGTFLADRVRLDKNKALETIATAPTSTARRVRDLFLMVMSRLPRQDETDRLVRYIEAAGDPNSAAQRQAVADVYWALLNSSEFMLNH